MPLFIYKATDSGGQVKEDTIQASSRDEAASILKADNYNVLTIKEANKRKNISFGGKIGTQEKAEMCRLLATMTRSGLSIPESVEIIKQETKNKKLEKVLGDIAFQTRKGNSVSSVFSQYPESFDPVFLTMVKAGEETGSLEKSFDYLSKQLSASHELSQKIKGSLMYPAVIIVAMLGNAVLMFVFVLPRIASAFTKMNIDLPTATRIFLNIGNFIGANTIIFLISVFLVTASGFFILYYHKTRKIIINFLGRLPVLKKMMDQIDIARFSRTLSTLLKSGVSIVESLDVASDSMGQPALRKQAKTFGQGVSKGENLSQIMMESDYKFPSVMVQTIRAGEKTGTLEEILEEMAEFYEKEVEHSLKKATALLEPIIMLVIGVAVGAMVIIMIAPIYSIVGNLSETVQK